MMFKGENYQLIRSAVKNQKNIEFEVDKSSTAFAGKEVPSDWTEYSLSILNKDDNDKLKGALALDKRIDAAFHKIELLASESGAKMYYRSHDIDTVGIKIEYNTNEL